MERHLTRYFANFGDGLPPPGLYHRILREVEHPLLTAALAATRGNQIRAADLLGRQPQHAAQEDPRLDIQVIRTSGSVSTFHAALRNAGQLDIAPRICRNSATLLYKCTNNDRRRV
jgi:hypothetical protein